MDAIPKELEPIFNTFYAETYQACEVCLFEAEKIGFTFEYGLDAMPYDFKKIDNMENFNMRYNTHLKRIRTFITPEGRFAQYDYTQDPYNRPCFFTVFESDEGFIIRNAFLPEFLQRLGIGTRFYIRMNHESKQITGKPLRSTQKRTLSTGEKVHELSPAAVALWESLTRKGMAEKIGHKNYVFTQKNEPSGI